MEDMVNTPGGQDELGSLRGEDGAAADVPREHNRGGVRVAVVSCIPLGWLSMRREGWNEPKV